VSSSKLVPKPCRPTRQSSGPSASGRPLTSTLSLIEHRLTFQRITLASLKKRSGLRLRDGSRVQYVSYIHSGTIDQVGKRNSGVFHKAQERYGIKHFASHGYQIFPWHIGLHGVNGWADFAVARYRRVILVECMTDGWENSLQRKAELALACELWFIVEPSYMKKLRTRGYKCALLPCPDTFEFRDLNTTFWICRPKQSRRL